VNELHVKGLLFESTEEQITEYFNTFGKVESINLIKGPHGSKGIAFVRMADEKGVTEAIAHSGEEFMGRKTWIEKSKTREERGVNNNNNFNQGYKNYNNNGYNNNRYNNRNYNNNNNYYNDNNFQQNE